MKQQQIFIDNYNQLDVFRAIISPILGKFEIFNKTIIVASSWLFIVL